MKRNRTLPTRSMIRTALNEKALKEASMNAQKAVDALYATEFEGIPAVEKEAWAMAAMIHCDMCRFVVALDECEPEGLARLLWMADVISKLFEAKIWYFKHGGMMLANIAKTKICGEKVVLARIKEIKARHSIGLVETYSNYRNKLGNHYGPNALEYLELFGKEDANSFSNLLGRFVKFSGEWGQLTSSLIKNQI